LYARPHDLSLVATGDGFPARVVDVRLLAGRSVLTLEIPQQSRTLEMEVGNGAQHGLPMQGTQVAVRPRRYQVFAGA